MAVLSEGDNGWIVSHELFVKNIYKKTKYSDEFRSFCLNPVLFDIKIPFLKSKCNSENGNKGDASDVDIVRKSYESLFKLYQGLNLCSGSSHTEDNISAKSLADRFYSQLTRHPDLKFLGGNSSEEALVSEIGKELYLIPEKSLFYCYDITDIADHLGDREFDLILMDPPWWNKYIRRKRKKNYKFGTMPMYLNDFIDLLAEISTEEGLKCTSRNIAGRIFTCITAALGGFLLGPLGLVVGAAIGAVLAKTTVPEVVPVTEILKELTRDQKQILSERVLHSFHEFGHKDFSAVAEAVASQNSMKSRAVKEITCIFSDTSKASKFLMNRLFKYNIGQLLILMVIDHCDVSECQLYDMVYDKDLSNIPINSMLSNNGLIAVWCTSAPSHINSVLNELFPAWGVQYITQWFWLKVTKSGKLICALSESSKKQPFERIIFGVKKNSTRSQPNPGNNKVIMSVPSAIHSHKPPLCEILKPYLPEEPRCLELFARYLLPGWTSYGNEVLKLQHMSLYNEENIKETS